jgi:hypothetical protein
MLAKLLTAKVAAIALTVVLGAATAAAMTVPPTGGRPSFAKPSVSTTLTTHAGTTSTTEKKDATETDTHTGTPASVTDPQALFGLCNAYLHNSEEAKAHSPVFKALAAAHPGTVAFCQNVVKNKPSDANGSDANDSNDQGKPSGVHGKPSTTPGGDTEHPDS